MTEEFREIFDRIGRDHAAGLAENPAETDPRLRDVPGAALSLEQFSEIAFREGTLSDSILDGTGRTALISCMKRAVGGQAADAVSRDSAGMLFRLAFAFGAVGLVVNTLRAAISEIRRLEEIAGGTGEPRGKDGGDLLARYPFLDDSRERKLLEQYTARLKRTRDSRKRAEIENDLEQLRALLAQKEQEKTEFLNKLRLISDRAVEAQAEFEAPGFVDEAAAALETPEEAPPPMEEPPPDTGDSHDPDRPEDRQPEDSAGADAPSGTGTEQTGP